MMLRRITGATLGLALLLPVAAFAQAPYSTTAYTNRQINVRAGPNAEFPQVTWLPAGVAVHVNGCVEGYAWCDVTAGSERGWVYADYLSYPYQNRPVSVYSVAPVIGFPLITFSVGSYWDSYYRHRPWYGNRAYWYGRPANWWYRAAPPRPYQPVVRPYTPYHGNGHWNNGNTHWNNNSNNHRPPNTHVQRPENRPPQKHVKPRVVEQVPGQSTNYRTYSQQ